MYTPIFLSTLLAASTALAAPSSLDRRDGAVAQVHAYQPGATNNQNNVCTGTQTNLWSSFDKVYLSYDKKMYCQSLGGSYTVGVTGSGCRTYYYTDDKCSNNKFGAGVPVSDQKCADGIGSISFDCSGDPLNSPSKPIEVPPAGPSSWPMSKRAEPTAVPV